NVKGLGQQFLVEATEDVCECLPALLLVQLLLSSPWWYTSKLVGRVVEVVDSNDNKVFISIIVAPVGCTGWNGQDVSSVNTMHPLVLIKSQKLRRGKGWKLGK
ncbi:unnamed protein product, partial [Ilex paraguariensis]